MALRNILFSDNPRLRKVSKPVKEINQRILTLLDDMAETMYEGNGVGPHFSRTRPRTLP